MSALLKIVTAFIVVVFLLLRKVKLGYCLLMGSLVLGILFGIQFIDYFKFTLLAFRDPANQKLIITLSTILILANVMGETRQLERIVSLARNVIRNPKIVLTAMPALIGFLPIPGGALFSAPLVEKTDVESEINPSMRSFINYWFRHVWEYFFPLYPEVVLATALTGIKISKFISIQFPLSITSIIVGFIVISRIKLTSNIQDPVYGDWKPLVLYVLPILIPIVLILIGVTSWLSILIGVFIALAINRKSTLEILIRVLRKFPWDVILNVVGVVVFKSFIENTGGIPQMVQFFTQHNFPIIVIITVAPFLVGLFSGMGIVPIGVTFPLIIPLAKDGNFYSTIMLAYACGFMGVMLSPAHLCLVVSNQYFDADIREVYRLLAIPVISIIIVALVLYLVKGG
jgi:integral membrane protein (TIGR00529 family)